MSLYSLPFMAPFLGTGTSCLEIVFLLIYYLHLSFCPNSVACFNQSLPNISGNPPAAETQALAAWRPYTIAAASHPKAGQEQKPLSLSLGAFFSWDPEVPPVPSVQQLPQLPTFFIDKSRTNERTGP